jgi:hypothetical protein
MRLLFIVLVFASFGAQAQMNVRDFGARGDGQADDYPAIQRAIDSAVKTHGRVYIPRGRYRISRPLVVALWTGKAYSTCSIEITGDSRMWDMRNQSVIIADFTDGFALGLHLNKGSIIRGIEVQGKYEMKYDLRTHYITELEDYNADPGCRDSRYSPYAGIVIDPFRPDLPPDGGYPSLQAYYRGTNSKSGSTGIRIEDVTTDKFVVGIIIAPNGFTLNADIITLQNIRIGATKVGFAGCQAQEKQNRLINIGAWGPCHTLFAWGIYGQGHPGHYYIEGVNAAGSVRQVVHRASQDWFPLYMTNIFAERIFRVGYWEGYAGDALSNAVFNFMDVRDVPAYPNNHLQSNSNTPCIAISNVTMMYYGQFQKPVLLRGQFKLQNAPNRLSYAPAVHGYRYNAKKPDSLLTQLENLIVKFYDSAGNRKLRISAGGLTPGEFVVFAQGSNDDIVGMGEVQQSGKTGTVIQYCSPGLKNNTAYRLLRYRPWSKIGPK